MTGRAWVNGRMLCGDAEEQGDDHEEKRENRGGENVPQEGFKARLANVSSLLHRLKKESRITISAKSDHSFAVSLALKPGEAVNCSTKTELNIYEAEGKYWTDEQISLALHREGFFQIWEEGPIDPFTWVKNGYQVDREDLDTLETKICEFLGISIPKTVFERFCLLAALFYSIEGMKDCIAMLDYFGIYYLEYYDDVD